MAISLVRGGWIYAPAGMRSPGAWSGPGYTGNSRFSLRGSMEVHVSILGTCVLAPSFDRTYLDVIIPETRWGPHPEHHPKIKYGDETTESLRNVRLDFSALGSRSRIADPLPGVHDVGWFCRAYVSADHRLPFDPHPHVISSIRLPAPDRPIPGQLVAFQIDTDPTHIVWLTHQYTFVYEDVTIDEIFRCQPLRASHPKACDPITIPTANANGVLSIGITHFPDDDPEPCPGDPVTHVHIYYDFFRCHGPDVILRSRNPNCGKAHREGGRKSGAQPGDVRTSLAYNCMLGQAPAG